jgi:hypothetical protein
MEELGGLARFAQRADASRADVQANAHSIHDNTLVLHVRAKIPAGASFRETHIVAKGFGFSANVTFPGHGGPPFK